MPEYIIYKTKNGWIAKRDRNRTFADALPEYIEVKIDVRTKFEAEQFAKEKNKSERITSVSSLSDTQTQDL